MHTYFREREDEIIRVDKDNTASYMGDPFEEPKNDYLVRVREFSKFIQFESSQMDFVSGYHFPLQETHGTMTEFFNGMLFFPDTHGNSKEQTKSSRPSPNKDKPLYEVSHLEHGGRTRKARVSGDIKLELTLRKNGQLADLGGLVKDLTIAYFGMEYEAEMEALFPDTDANAA